MAMLQASAAMPAMPGVARDAMARGRAFMAKLTGAEKQVADGAPLREAAPVTAPTGEAHDREQVLRWLARTQKLDGSWNADVEWTAAAALAFVRAGHTTRAGNYRQALRRAARYLAEHGGGGRLADFLRARALAELADASGDTSDRAAAQDSQLALPPAENALEMAAAGQQVQAPGAITSLDDLRLACLLRIVLPVPREIFAGKQGDLARVWMATIAP